MREVHRSQLDLSLNWLESQGVALTDLYAHTGLEPIDEVERDGYVSWDYFARCLNGFAHWFELEEAADGISQQLMVSSQVKSLFSLVRTVSDASGPYVLMHRFFGPRLFPCATTELSRPRPGELRIDMRIERADPIASPLYILTSKRMFERMPAVLMGLPEAVVHIEPSRRQGGLCTFVLELPQFTSIWSKLRVARRLLFDGGYAMEMMETQQRELLQRLREIDRLEREAEERLAQRNAELARLTADLQEARDQARRESEAKSKYLANLSHELRTPLNAIIGGTEMVIEEMQDDGESPYTADLERISVAGRHLLRLIEHVLDLSKIEAGRMSLNCERVDLELLLKESVAPLELLARREQTTIELDYHSQIGRFQGDGLRIKQIVTNLLGNAMKFGKGGEIVLRASSDVARGEVQIEVEDEGIGIDPEKLTSLFEPFEQANAADTHKHFGGTGLGLTISRQLARLMGGDLTVRSTPGEGSTFTLRLPVSEASS